MRISVILAIVAFLVPGSVPSAFSAVDVGSNPAVERVWPADSDVAHGNLATMSPPADPGKYRLIGPANAGAPLPGDSYDIAAIWACNSGQGYLADTGMGPGPCTGQTYDYEIELCGLNVFSGAGVDVVELETNNGNGTTTVIVQVNSGDGSDMLPPGNGCPAPINILGCDLAKHDAGGPGVPGDPLNPNLGVSPFEILEAEAVIFGTGGSVLLAFDLNSSGQMATVLRDKFTVGGADMVTITAMQFRYLIATGEFTGACCGVDDVCTEGMTGVECANSGGTYLGDFSSCPGPNCGVVANDDCTNASTITDGNTPFDTTDATLDASAPPPCDADMMNDLWFRYTASCSGQANIGTCQGGAGPDTVIEVYDEADCRTARAVACEDDSGCGAGGLSASASVSVTSGQEITIRLGGSGGAAVSGMLTVTCNPVVAGGACCLDNFSCAAAPSQTTCTNAGGTYLGDGTVCGITYTPITAASSTIHFETCGSSYNTEISVYDACGGDLLAFNDDCSDTASGGGADPFAACYDGDSGSQERDSCVCLSTTPGTVFLVQVRGFGGTPPPPGSSTSLFVTHGGACNPLPAGACCQGEVCTDFSQQSFCENEGGTYQGDGTECAEVTCSLPPPEEYLATFTDGSAGQNYIVVDLDAGFFGDGCEALSEQIELKSLSLNPAQTGNADTALQRSGDPVSPSDPIGTMGTVDVELTALSLRSTHPITVICNGAATKWDVSVNVSPTTPAPTGSMAATKSHLNGGTSNYTVYLRPFYQFEQVGGFDNGDLNGDGVVNSTDYALFHGCLDGPGRIVPTGCDRGDFDGDGDVDMADAGAMFLILDPEDLPGPLTLDTGLTGDPPLELSANNVPFVHSVDPSVDARYLIPPGVQYVSGIEEMTPGDTSSQERVVVEEMNPLIERKVTVPERMPCTISLVEIKGARENEVGNYNQLANPKQPGRLFVDTVADGQILANPDQQYVDVKVQLGPPGANPANLEVIWLAYDADDPADHVDVDPNDGGTAGMPRGNLGKGGDNIDALPEEGAHIFRMANHAISGQMSPGSDGQSDLFVIGEAITQVDGLLQSTVRFHYGDEAGDNYIITAICREKDINAQAEGDTTATLTVWRKRLLRVSAMEKPQDDVAGDGSPNCVEPGGNGKIDTYAQTDDQYAGEAIVGGGNAACDTAANNGGNSFYPDSNLAGITASFRESYASATANRACYVDFEVSDGQLATTYDPEIVQAEEPIYSQDHTNYHGGANDEHAANSYQLLGVRALNTLASTLYGDSVNDPHSFVHLMAHYRSFLAGGTVASELTQTMVHEIGHSAFPEPDDIHAPHSAAPHNSCCGSVAVGQGANWCPRHARKMRENVTRAWDNHNPAMLNPADTQRDSD